MGEANRRCKDRDERIKLAIEREAEERAAIRQKEAERIASMTPEEKEIELNKKQKQSKISSILNTALILTKSPF